MFYIIQWWGEIKLTSTRTRLGWGFERCGGVSAASGWRRQPEWPSGWDLTPGSSTAWRSPSGSAPGAETSGLGSRKVPWNIQGVEITIRIRFWSWNTLFWINESVWYTQDHPWRGDHHQVSLLELKYVVLDQSKSAGAFWTSRAWRSPSRSAPGAGISGFVDKLLQISAKTSVFER